MLDQYSHILKAVSTQKDSETFEIEKEDFRNEVWTSISSLIIIIEISLWLNLQEDEGEKMTDYIAYREELLEY